MNGKLVCKLILSIRNSSLMYIRLIISCIWVRQMFEIAVGHEAKWRLSDAFVTEKCFTPENKHPVIGPGEGLGVDVAALPRVDDDDIVLARNKRLQRGLRRPSDVELEAAGVCGTFQSAALCISSREQQQHLQPQHPQQ